MNVNIKKTLVSVIIPVYNAEQYLRRCIDSVLSQDYENTEIILVDDGSTDRSGGICDDYASKDSRVVVVHIPNGGASMARKKGLDLSNGQYVTFVDSDDWASPEYVSTLFQLIEEYGVNVSACGVQRVKDGKQPETQDKVFKSQLLSFEELMPRFFKYEFWGFWGKLYKKTSVESLSFPQATISEDYYVMTQLFDKERQMAYTDTPLYYYEYHDNSLSHQSLSRRAFEEFENVKNVYEYTCVHMLQYRDMAFSNVLETAVKLSLFKEAEKKRVYKTQYDAIRTFLKERRTDIIKNHYVARGVKILALGISVNKKFTLSFYNIFRVLK